MNRAQFLQEKLAFLLAHPEQDELAFYRWFAERHPNAPIGWLYLGREWEKRGRTDRALEAYRRAAAAADGDAFAEEARDLYHALLRRRRRQVAARVLRRAALLLSTALLLVIPRATGEIEEDAAPPANLAPGAVPSGRSLPEHAELITVPAKLSGDALRRQVEAYLASRRGQLKQPFTLLVAPEASGVPLFTPLPFYLPKLVKGVVRYDPGRGMMLAETWFSAPCPCQNHPAVRQASRLFLREQRVLEEVLTLRNAVYRAYQRTGRLPRRLSDLAQAYPANDLPAVPLLPPEPGTGANPAPSAASGQEDGWEYDPAAFLPDQPWESLRRVLPPAGYPEPALPLAPLTIVVNQQSYTMTLMSGSHIVRRYPIGVGRDGSTPEGTFAILRKINHPEGPGHLYGSRGLVFASDSYAIHGTNQPESIGQARSHGCIRLHNQDVEELYSFVSPGTDVVITNAPAAPVAWFNGSPFILPAGADEETPNRVYRWLH